MKAVVGCVSWIYSRYTEMVSMDTGHPEAFLLLQGDNQQDTWKSSLIRFLPPEAGWSALFIFLLQYYIVRGGADGSGMVSRMLKPDKVRQFPFIYAHGFIYPELSNP